MLKKKIYMIGSAHLDPVWMWRWQEGCAEAKATFRSALDRMNEFPDYKFTCAAAALYGWIEDIDPEMFAEIKERVAEGRWVVVGGWWIQPDCNLPSGESYARHALYSQRYFKEKLGVTARVGYNVDSFGHNKSLPQLLKKSGMDYYVFMRPMQHEKSLESNMFNWRSPDGTTVKAFRIPLTYACNFDSKEKLDAHIKAVCENSDPNANATMVFYGVGNHGGGPTKLNLSFIEELKREYAEKGVELIYSGPESLFKTLEEDGTPLFTLDDDLQHHASGCYSTLSALKKSNRAAENRLAAAEIYSSLAGVFAGRRYEGDAFRTAWENILFNQFHDSMGGCSIKPVYTDALEMAGQSLAVAAKQTNSALQRLSWRIDTSDGVYAPLVMFNPLSWPVKALIRVNNTTHNVRRVVDEKGDNVRIQFVRSEAVTCFGRADTLVEAVLPPMGWTVYRGYDEPAPELENEFRVTGDTLENSRLKVSFEPHTGYISSITNKADGRELISGKAAVPVVIDEYYHDTWSHGRNFFDNVMARFSDAEITVIENGPLRAMLKVVSRYNRSTLTQYFTLAAGSDRLEVSCVVDWQEKHKMLKLACDINASNPRAFYEIPYSVIERPCDGEEEPGERWIAVRGDNGGVAMLNDCKYSFSIKGSTLNLTVVRSPIYGDHGNTRLAESPFTDIGAQEFTYTLLPLSPDTPDSVIVRAASELNRKPEFIVENNHRGVLAQTVSGLSRDSDNVIVSALKRAEDDSGWIIRAYECDGKLTECVIKVDMLKAEIKTVFHPYEIRTLLLSDDGGWREVMLTEYDY